MTLASRKHVVFDLDGTLVDTRAAVTECYTIVFREKLGSAFPPDGDFPIGELFAMRPPEVFAIVAPGRVEELHAAYRAAYPRCTAHVKVFAGIREMIFALRDGGRAVSVVTNKGIERTLIDLDVARIPHDSFETIVTAEDTVERKPHPAPIQLGLQRVGATPDEAVYVGDGPQDVLAARAAGMAVVAVSYGFYPAEALARLDPDAIAGSVAELAAALGVEPARRAAP